MNDPLVRILMIIALYWCASLAWGMVSGPAWGFMLGSAALLGLLSFQMSRADAASGAAQPAPGLLGGMDLPGAPWAQADASKLVAAGVPASASCGVGVLDAELRLSWCNDALAKHFGIGDVSAAIGEPAGRLSRNSSLAGYLAKGRFSEPLRLEPAQPGGAVLILHVVPYTGTQRVLLSLDITRAELAENRRREYLDNALHELRAPMMVLSWSVDVMRTRAPDDLSVRERLDVMTEHCRRMRQITEDLRNLSALETSHEPPAEPVGVETLLGVVQAEAEARAGGRQRVTLAAQPGFDLLGSRTELASVFSNLASNAIQYTPAGGEIRMTWRASGAGAEFVVEDTGIGIAKEHIPRLTERFYQVDRAASRRHGGAGLGLAIVNDVLGRHQATLDIASEPGKGSRFTVCFPAHRVTMDARCRGSSGDVREDLAAVRGMPLPVTGEQALGMPTRQAMANRAYV